MSKCLLISWLQSPSTVIFEPKKINLEGEKKILCCIQRGKLTFPFLSQFGSPWPQHEHFYLRNSLLHKKPTPLQLMENSIFFGAQTFFIISTHLSQCSSSGSIISSLFQVFKSSDDALHTTHLFSNVSTAMLLSLFLKPVLWYVKD